MQTTRSPGSLDPILLVPHLGAARTFHNGIGGHLPDGDLADPVPAPARSAAAVVTRRGWYLPVKLAVEWAAALVLLTLLSPLILALAALVKVTSEGPAFYAQSRLGHSGRRYQIYKLRTMKHNCEVKTGPVWAKKNDCRITPVGRLLRSTHLDELPQLWNVLRGEMGLIGPRPERPEIAGVIADDLPEFRLRLQLRPGITGLAQMLLPADDPDDAALRGVKAKLAHDLLYVQDVSPLLDVRIAVSTSCYFAAAAINAVRLSVIGSCGTAARGCPLALDDCPPATRGA